MLKKFISGLVFGSGFGIAFFLIWALGVIYLLPKMLETSHKVPNFENPQVAEVAKANPSSSVSKPSKEFSFFKRHKMEIPKNGGILSISPSSVPENGQRPNTYQLWLTHSELWQIRTIGEKTEIEKLPYPDEATPKTLNSIMYKNLGMSARQSTMTISEYEINELISGGESIQDVTLNGKKMITVEGIVFVLPNIHKT